jgi:signal transduction histidine kinase
MGTAKGLSCFYPHQATIRFCNFDQRDGLVQDHLNNELYVSETGHILIGFAGSLTSFHPDSLLALRPAAPFTIYSLKIFDKEAALDSTIELKKRVQLEYDENFFTLSFSVLQYINPKRNQYRYQLEGYDNRWNNAGNRGYATYTKVPPGEYIFRVKSTNNYLGGNEQERTIRIIILPPWWNTWWAYMGYGLLAAAALLLGRREVVKRERLRADLRVKQVESQKWQELDAMKSRFFANISHEFRTPLTLILGTSDELLEQLKQGAEYKQQYELIKRNAQRLLRLINQLMDLSRLEAGRLQLETEPNSITHFLNTIVQSFSSLADRRGIDYRLHLPKQDHWALFDRDKL